jgi:hypothetical protein
MADRQGPKAPWIFSSNGVNFGRRDRLRCSHSGLPRYCALAGPLLYSRCFSHALRSCRPSSASQRRSLLRCAPVHQPPECTADASEANGDSLRIPHGDFPNTKPGPETSRVSYFVPSFATAAATSFLKFAKDWSRARCHLICALATAPAVASFVSASKVRSSSAFNCARSFS